MKELNLIKFINPICNIVIQAGNIILKYYKSNTDISLKKDKSPLTNADLESNEFIIESLLKLYKEIPIFSEESLVDWDVRKDWKTYWLIDPLDGTKEFINESDEFTINIALINDNRPVLGIIYAPALSVLYFAFKGGGSYKILLDNREHNKDFLNNALKLKITLKSAKNFLKVICSKSHPNEEFNQWINNNLSRYKIIKKGSSIKFGNIAEGTADIYPRFRPSSEWDIAAGHIIVLEAGGKLESVAKKEILYNLKESVINPYFIASCKLKL